VSIYLGDGLNVFQPGAAAESSGGRRCSVLSGNVYPLMPRAAGRRDESTPPAPVVGICAVGSGARAELQYFSSAMDTAMTILRLITTSICVTA